jgi:DNA-binding transcriptional regulator LsrR (DeoR family)
MTSGRRASADERARRINVAAGLLDDGVTVPEATRELAGRFGLSERQARRYVDQARQRGPVAVPEPTVVFTVRLPEGLVAGLRRHANATGRTLSSLVAEAIESLLDRHGQRRSDG